MNEKKVLTLDQMIAAHQKSHAEVAALKTQVAEVAAAGGEPNVITTIKNNGTALEVTDKAVDIGTSIAAAVAAAPHLKRKIVASKDAIDVSAADADQYIYMVLKSSAKTADKYEEYMVIDGAVEKVGDWEVDLSGYQAKEEGKGLSANDYTDDDKAKLDGLVYATDAEVTAALNEIYGADEA